jgi:hypothetical protein
MYFTSAKFTVLVVCILTLAACASQKAMVVSPMSAPASWSQITKMQVLFKGDDMTVWSKPLEANAALLNAANLQKTLDLYGSFPNPGDLGDLISNIETANDSANDPVPGMTGLGGVHGRAFLDVAKMALNNNGMFDNARQVVVSVFGQITEYEFNKSASDPTRGNGRLVVITYVTSTKVPLGNGNNIPKTEAYRWHVRVENNGFQIVPRSNVNPTDPFPGTLAFTPAMLARINLLGFQYKLWAKGTDIKIDNVEQKAGNSSNWITLPKTNPKYKRLYAEIDENCIDMMFVNEPPMTLTDGMKPPFYCLGRCASPLIVNTGE